eukprot:gene21415-biopygen7349
MNSCHEEGVCDPPSAKHLPIFSQCRSRHAWDRHNYMEYRSATIDGFIRCCIRSIAAHTSSRGGPERFGTAVFGIWAAAVFLWCLLSKRWRFLTPARNDYPKWWWWW